MSGYYNEIDPYAAQWLRNLIDAGLIPEGDVDERSIADVDPSDLAGYTQCHFFAGLGGWPYAARLAGWPDDKPVWTGSPPCQPFSVAGQKRGSEDERHLWPELFRLIRSCRPPVFFGEQVAAAAGATKLKKGKGHRALKEMAKGEPGTVCSVEAGKPHEEPCERFDCECEKASEEKGLGVRSGQVCRPDTAEAEQRNLRGNWSAIQYEWRRARLGYPLFGSDFSGSGLFDHQRKDSDLRAERHDADLGTGSSAGNCERCSGKTPAKGRVVGGAVRQSVETPTVRDWLDGVRDNLQDIGYTCWSGIAPCCAVNAPHRRDRLWIVADSKRKQRHRSGPRGTTRRDEFTDCCGEFVGISVGERLEGQQQAGTAQRPVVGACTNHWADAEWLPGPDGKARRAQPGVRLLAHGVPARVAKLRALGNAIVPQVAAEVMGAYLECGR